MGISGLLPTLRSIIEQRHVSKYAGTKVAVDTVRPTAGAAPHDLHVIVSSTTPRTTLTRRTAPHSMAGFTKGATVARWSSVLAPRQTGVPLSTAEDAVLNSQRAANPHFSRPRSWFVNRRAAAAGT
jgi:hypothetical protein